MMSTQMNAKALKEVIVLLLATALLVFIYTSFSKQGIINKTELVTFYNGSSNVDHDIQFGGLVNGPVIYGLYCLGDAGDLVDGSKLGDVVISGRADSYDCSAIDDNIKATVVAGYGNVNQYVDQIIEGALIISQGSSLGSAYGPGIDYYVEANSLSEAMPYMANMLLNINNARIIAGLPAYTIYEMDDLLTATSDGVYVKDGKEYGKIINMDKAVEYAVNETHLESCPMCTIPAMLYILGE